MSGKLRLGTESYVRANPHKIAIYNEDYDENGVRTQDTRFNWVIQYGRKFFGGGFPSQQDATDWLREHLNTQAVS